MEDDSGFAVRIAAGLPVHKVPVADIEHAVVVWFDLWVKLSHVFSVNVVGHPAHSVVQMHITLMPNVVANRRAKGGEAD